MGWLTRRRFLMLAGAAAVGTAAGLVGLRYSLPRFFRPGSKKELSTEAQAFVDTCFDGIQRSLIWDSHVHILGLGNGDSGCWVNPEMRSQGNPVSRFRYDVFAAAVGMEDERTADADYLSRLLDLHRAANPSGKLVCLAFDMFVDEHGEEHPELSSFHTPDDYVLQLAATHPEVVPCVSIHPYRVDAIDRLEAAAAGGARAVKWLPNSMGIDPAAARCDAFFRKLVELDLPLISHAGREYAVEASHDQELGNPQRLRRALDEGVRVIVAHCASFGSVDDLDSPDGQRRQTEAFDLFMKMFLDPRYERNLFADISGLTLLNRSARVLDALVSGREFHQRLLFGTDYPLPALHLLFSTGKLWLQGFLDEHQRAMCNELAEVNPLLFDFAVKRSLQVEREGRVDRFSPEVFETARLLGGPPAE